MSPRARCPTLSAPLPDLLRRLAVEAIRNDQQLTRVAVLQGMVRRSAPYAGRWIAVTSHRTLIVREVVSGRSRESLSFLAAVRTCGERWVPPIRACRHAYDDEAGPR